jgi:hypothetical protein
MNWVDPPSFELGFIFGTSVYVVTGGAIYSVFKGLECIAGLWH